MLWKRLLVGRALRLELRMRLVWRAGDRHQAAGADGHHDDDDGQRDARDRVAQGIGVVLSGDMATTAGAISSDTRFITLISGLIAGLAVSLNGSPTVSPITVAAWATEPLPPWWPSSTSFLALSHAPPELARNTAINVPAAMAPAR